MPTSGDEPSLSAGNSGEHAAPQLGGQAGKIQALASLKSKDASERRRAVQILGGLQDSDAIQYLISALHDREFHVRNSALIALKKYGVEAAPLLIQAYPQFDRETQETDLARLFAEMGADATGIFLTTVPVTDDHNLRLDLLSALALFQEERAIPLLYQEALTYNDKRIVYGLRRYEPDILLPVIVRLFSHDSSAARSVAVRTIAYMQNTPTSDYLLQALNDPDQEVVRRAIESLGFRSDELNKSEVEIKLLYLLETGEYPVREAAIEALPHFASGRSLQKMMQVIETRESTYWQEAYLVIQAIDDKSYIPFLLHQLEVALTEVDTGGGHSEWGVEVITDALNSMEAVLPEALMLNLLSFWEYNALQHAASLARLTGSPQVGWRLLEMWQNGEIYGEIMEYAPTAIVDLLGDQAIPTLEQLYRNSEGHEFGSVTRWEVETALTHLATSSATAALKTLLELKLE
ncbi:MAG: HEAT repeat domain-containing protein [Anaerolineae bacterium]|nr:HEAT repeat domain-containing protein [Anaerolineae bacterium]